MSGKGEAPTLADQVKAFTAFATTDGEISNGGDHPEETAAAEAREQAAVTAREAAKKPQQVVAEPAEGEAVVEPAVEEPVDGETPEEAAARVAAAAVVKPAKKTAAQRQAEIQTRIDASTRELREIERRIEAAKTASVAAIPQPLTEKTQGATEDANAPKASDFEYGELDGKFIRATAVYEAKKAYAAEKAADEQKTQQTRLQAEQAENRVKRDAVIAKGVEKYDDFQEVVVEAADAGRFPISETVGKLLLTSDVGADIAYHLATHPDEARTVAGKPLMEQAAYFGRLEARFSAPASGATATKVVKTTQAPLPIRTARGGGGSTQTSPATNDFAAFEKMAREAQK